ncbi:MAG: septum site-determining protein MinC, partial [Hydrococcus sp. SU_1_0]|nr:septum site-determining protein MinC [Hydrococcus sp. SU_1_0]
MTYEPTISLDKNDELADSSPRVHRYAQIYLKHDGDQMLLVLPSQAEINADLPWSETWQELKTSVTNQGAVLAGRDKCVLSCSRSAADAR